MVPDGTARRATVHRAMVPDVRVPRAMVPDVRGRCAMGVHPATIPDVTLPEAKARVMRPVVMVRRPVVMVHRAMVHPRAMVRHVVMVRRAMVRHVVMARRPIVMVHRPVVMVAMTPDVTVPEVKARAMVRAAMARRPVVRDRRATARIATARPVVRDRRVLDATGRRVAGRPAMDPDGRHEQRPARCGREDMRLIRALLVLPLLPACLVFDGGLDGALNGDWVARTPSPCGFNRMDALHVDDDGTIWTGCGTNTEGFGLFRSVDDGASWAMVDPPNARDFFVDYRVNTISRSADGLLYVGGTGGGVMVLALADDDSATVVLETGAQTGTSFSVGHFRRDSAGRALAESLTGTDTLGRASDDDAFAGAGVFEDGVVHQILDLTPDGDTFHGVGSTIGEPNLYFKETTRAGQPIAFDVVELSGGALGFDGELRAVAARDGVVVTGGVDEDADQAVIHVVTGDDVRSVRVADVIADLDRSTVRGACAGPGLFVVVGEETVTNGSAFVLASRDAGATWQDLTPELPTVPAALTRCTITDRITVAGGGGAVLSGPLD